MLYITKNTYEHINSCIDVIKRNKNLKSTLTRQGLSWDSHKIQSSGGTRWKADHTIWNSGTNELLLHEVTTSALHFPEIHSRGNLYYWLFCGFPQYLKVNAGTLP
jgi:hypothetical protein